MKRQWSSSQWASRRRQAVKALRRCSGCCGQPRTRAAAIAWARAVAASASSRGPVLPGSASASPALIQPSATRSSASISQGLIAEPLGEL
jgi:hypothetical protein